MIRPEKLRVVLGSEKVWQRHPFRFWTRFGKGCLLGLQTRPYSGCDSISTPDQPNIPIMFDWAGETAILRKRNQDFHSGPRAPLMRREGRSLRPPIFQKPFPVWH